MLVRVDHVQLALPAGSDAERAAVGFYEGLLGLRRVPKPEPLASRGGCWFTNGTVDVHLGTEDPFRPARKAHPAFAVDDLDELLAHLRTAGTPVHLDTELPGTHRAHVEDPFGNRIELIQA